MKEWAEGERQDPFDKRDRLNIKLGHRAQSMGAMNLYAVVIGRTIYIISHKRAVSLETEVHTFTSAIQLDFDLGTGCCKYVHVDSIARGTPQINDKIGGCSLIK